MIDIKRFLFSFGFTFTLTVAAGEFLLKDSWIVGAAAVAAFAFSVLLFLSACLAKKKKRFREICFSAAFLSLAVAFGAARWSYADFHYARTGELFAGKSVELTLEITEESRVTRSGAVLYTARPLAGNPFSYSVSFSDRSGLNLEVYDRIQGTFSAELPLEDYRSKNRAENKILYLTLEKDTGYDILRSEDKPFGYCFVLLRRSVKTTFSRWLGEASGFACGMMTGDSGGLSEADYDALARAGLLHVTAVSGLHVSLLCSLLMLVLKPVRIVPVRLLLCGGCIFLLCGICGFTPSAVRAAVMTGFSFLPAFCPGKPRYEPLNGLGLAALLILGINPMCIGSASFLLSFSSTLGILVLCEPLTEKISSFAFRRFSFIPGKISGAVIACFSVSVSCFLFSAPVTVLCFGTLTPAGILSNLLVFFLFPVVFALCLVLLLFSAIPGLSSLCFLPAFFIKIGVNYIMSVARHIAALDFATFELSRNRLPVILILLFIAAFSVGLLLLGKRARKKKQKKKYLFLSVVLVILSAAVFLFVFAGTFFPGNLASSDIQIAFLNVGQGSCIVVRDGDMTVVYDCGGTVSPAGTAETWLRKNEVDEIDYLVVSHLHDDHANGVASLCGKYPVGTICFPAAEGEAELESEIRLAAMKYDIPILSLSEDFEFSSERLSFHLLTAHIDPDSDDQNENCVVLKLDYLDFTALFTGDIPSAAEKRLLDSYGAFSVDVLAVPHHGSSFSSSDEFLFRLAPSVSVISVGAGNTYGHPADEVVSRLLSYGSVFLTKDSGTVTVTTDGTSIFVSTEK